jgi:hypothetical protein
MSQTQYRIPTLDRVLTYLGTGKTLTARTAANKFGVQPHTVRARISEARSYGYSIATTSRQYRNRTISVYSF